MNAPGNPQGSNPTQRAPAIPSIEVSNNCSSNAHTYQLIKPMITIGRHQANDIVVDFPFVSGSHLKIEGIGEQFFIVHPVQGKTVNGLIYQGRHIQGDESFRKALVHGDVFRIGDEHGTLVTLTFDDGSRQNIVPDVHPIPLRDQEITIGRQNNNTVVLPHPQVSSYHARLVSEKGAYRVIDLGSTNHVYVNGKRTVDQLLNINDEIRIGPFKFVYTGTRLIQYDESNGIRIEALNLKKFGNNQVVLLNDISFTIPPRKFVALVGGSGTGKSTLMNALNGFSLADEGMVLYNGQDYYKFLAAFRTQIGYVPQEDIVHRELTVERALYYAAKMRLPEDFTKRQIMQRIDEVLEEVDMTERRNLSISKISGGQRKRVSIALELLAKPTVFFLDEPTSGLDPGLDYKMMQVLRRLADKGHTIVLVTHAISNINLCDYVCFLAPGGYLAYFGPPEGVKSYFGQTDFAEIYNLLEPTKQDPHIPKKAGDRFKNFQGSAKSAQVPQQQGKMKHLKVGNRWKQFWLLSTRYIELLWNDKVNLGILLLQAPVIGLLLLLFILGIGTGGFDPTNVVQCPTTASVLTPAGQPDLPTPYNPSVSKSCKRLEDFLTKNPRGKAYTIARGGELNALQDFITPGPGNAPTILFIMAFSAIMFGCINAAREIVKEASIYRRERAVTLGIIPYLFSKVVVLGLLCLLQSAVLVFLVNVFDPFHQGIFLPPLLEVYLTIALISLVGLMMGLTISAIAPNNDRAISLLPLILIPQVIFSGTIFPLNKWFLQIPGALFAIRWAMAALGSSVGLHTDKLNGDTLFGDNYTYHGVLLSTYDKGDATYYLLLMWLALGVMIVVFGFVSGFFLKRKDVRR